MRIEVWDSCRHLAYVRPVGRCANAECFRPFHGLANWTDSLCILVCSQKFDSGVYQSTVSVNGSAME